MENVYFFFVVVGFVNNSDSFFFIFGEQRQKKQRKYQNMCTFILYRTEKKITFSLNIAKWVCDIADCCYHDASCMLGKKKTQGKQKERRLFCTGCFYVREELLEINTDTVVNTHTRCSCALSFSFFCARENGSFLFSSF